MKTGMRWMALAVAALVSTGAWAAVWNPDADAALLFNMNFETYDNTPPGTATDAKALLVGTLEDYNEVDPNVFGEIGRAGLGYDANFAEIHDSAPGKGIPEGNDVKLKMQPTYLFNLGNVTKKHTWTFWFNVPNLTNGTIIRHASFWLEYEGYTNLVWEIRIYGGKLHFWHRNNSLRMETASTLTELELTTNEWHSAAIVIDRSDTRETTIPTKQLSTKIYIDGLEVPVIVSSLNENTMDIDTESPPDSPLWIGAGEREFDGLLDEIRLFSRVLTPVEVSLLNQPETNMPRALLPIPRSEDVVIGTDLTWVPAATTPAPTAQSVYFGTDPENFGDPCASGSGTLNTVNLAGDLVFNTTYYWYVKSTINGSPVDGPLWSFTSETGKAINPSPADGEEDVPNSDANLIWATPTAATYDVYVSTDRTLVENNDIDVNVGLGISNPYIMGFDPCNIGGRGEIYYWRVNSYYASLDITVPGDIWQFRTNPYDLVFNTSGQARMYADREIPAYACVRGDTWETVLTGYLDGTLADGNAIAVFNFNSGFSYDRRYDIVVIPAYRARDVNSNFNIFPTPLDINVTGDFYFDGRVQIAGDDVVSETQSYARSGGFPGPKGNQNASIYGDSAVPGNSDISGYWTSYPFNPADANKIFHHRFGTGSSSTAHYLWEPTELSRRVYGPGVPVCPPYKGGGGGGAGGIGGDAGRGYFFGVFSGGPTYGDKEVPIPFGGSAGGWGDTRAGGAGGGGIEIIATGNVVLDSNSQIRAMGGGQVGSSLSYPSGGGAGGSVRIIAGGSVTNKGIINVSGGKGGAGAAGNNTGGGGAGGRVAIFYGTSYDGDDGEIILAGGAKGTSSGTGLAQNGEDGTFFPSSGSPKKASAPNPQDGNDRVYCSGGSCPIQLKWYSGYCDSDDIDEVFCDTNPDPSTSRGSVAATRGQHSVSMTVSPGNTYYWKVKTDGAVDSDIWSFKVVNWQCPIANPGNYPHPAGLEWDANHNCVLDIEDFATFAQDWVNSGFGDTYFLNNVDFSRFAGEFGWCVNRSDGCPGYTNPNP